MTECCIEELYVTNETKCEMKCITMRCTNSEVMKFVLFKCWSEILYLNKILFEYLNPCVVVFYLNINI